MNNTVAIKGKETVMAWEWLPGAIIGALGSFITGLLSWRISAAQQQGKGEEQVRTLQEKAAALQAGLNQEGMGLRESMRQLREDLRGGLADDLRTLRDEMRGQRDDMKASTQEVRSLAATTASLQASQDAVNKFTANALESLSNKVDDNCTAIADHGATLRLITEILARNGAGLKSA